MRTFCLKKSFITFTFISVLFTVRFRSMMSALKVRVSTNLIGDSKLDHDLFLVLCVGSINKTPTGYYCMQTMTRSKEGQRDISLVLSIKENIIVLRKISVEAYYTVTAQVDHHCKTSPSLDRYYLALCPD